MKLSEVVRNLSETQLEVSRQTLETDILQVTADSRSVQPGSLFVAIRGSQKDGHELIPEALARGASFVIGEDLKKMTSYDTDLPGFKGRWICLPSARQALQKVAQTFYHDPSVELFCVGVTGTNGKTSITYMLEHVFNAARRPMGVLGTINHHFAEQVWSSSLTTPDPVALQGRLRQMADLGAKAIAMEVSSHALDQKRSDGVHFNTAIFTNLTRDHLDFHQNMKSYFSSKQRLFTELLHESAKPYRWAVVNVDDPWGRQLRVDGPVGVLTYGRTKADFQFEVKQVDFGRTDFDLQTPQMKLRTSIPMCGLHNVYNAVAVIAAASTGLISPIKSAEALAHFTGVPGRMQFVENSQALNVFVDYAHSPDALENVLNALIEVRKLSGTAGKIWCVFGCGGDRDRGKRPQMAKTAAQLADHVMITSDNPRTEDPETILNEIAAGFGSEQKYLSQVDRRKAIAEVLNSARPHDVILIAGKGHEDYQIIGTEKLHFSDVEVVKEILR